MSFWNNVKINKKIEEGSSNPNEIRVKKIEKVEKDGLHVKYSNEDMVLSLDEINKYFPKQVTQNFRFMIFWDEFVQLTGLGMLDKINTELYKDDEFTYGTLSYLKRDNPYTDTIDAVYEILCFYKEFRLSELDDYCKWKNITGKKKDELVNLHTSRYTVTKEMLSKYYKNHYFGILQHSPYNGAFTSMVSTLNKTDDTIFVFKHDFEERKKLIEELDNTFNKKKRSFFTSETLDDNTIDDLLIKYNPNVIFSVNGAKVYDSIIRNKLEKIEIFTHEVHNGFDDNFLLLLSEFSDGKHAQNNCIIHQYSDSISIIVPRDGSNYIYD